MTQRVLFILLFLCCGLLEANDTVLKLYRPYGDVYEQVAPVLKNTLTGRCLGQSQLILREDAWRCEAGGKVYDPCFVKAGPNRKEALCLQSPWVADSVLIQVSAPLNNATNQTLDMAQAYPWGIELSNGERCLAIHSTQEYDQMPIRYQCTNQNSLVGHLQRCKNVWTMLEKTTHGIETVELQKAWF